MQEFNYDRFWVDTSGTRWRPHQIEARSPFDGMPYNISKEELIKSPLEMYLYALSIKEKLPEDLHNAMLLWSYDQDSSEYVKSYLDWLERCDERKKSREKFEKQMRLHDKVMKFSMALTFVLLLIALFSNAFK